jgi:mannobiose 2-epimerase
MQNNEFKNTVRELLEENILKYWIERVTDHENGGYFGRVDGHDFVHLYAPKGAVLNARILWAFSAAYRVLGNAEYLDAATRALDYFLDNFIDKEQGGVFWSLDYMGKPLDTKKQTYAIGFAIYGLSEYARATGSKRALDSAINLYYDIEKKAYDCKGNGYIEALTREWQPIQDMRLSDKDENGSRTMNTHLHIIEPYTNLYRVWKSEDLKKSILNLIDIFTEKLLNKETNHLDLFFDDEWHGKRNIESYGHDIECSWLMHEAALVLGDKDVLAKVEPIVQMVAKASEKGLRPDGSMIHEANLDTGHVDDDLHWWVQAENVVGWFNIYQYFGDKEALRRADRCWNYIKNQIIDWENGEWHWSRHPDGTLNTVDDKAGFWKCPYHNSRMCLEIIERTAEM